MKYRKITLFGAFLAFSICVGCGDDEAEETNNANNVNNTNTDPRVAQVAALEGDASAGESDFNSVCVTCHAMDGTGVENLGNDLTVSTLSRQEIIDTILNGRGTMVGYESAFTDQEVADLAAYALEFRQ